MTAPGGGNFFSKSSRREEKARIKKDLPPVTAEPKDTMESKLKDAGSEDSYTVINLPDRDAKAKQAVAEAEAANRKKYGR